MVSARTGPLGVLSATGNMLYRDASGDLAEVATAAASNGQVLSRESGVPAWAPASRPYGSYYLSASAATVNTSGTPIKIAGTTVALALDQMTMPANNRLQNIGIGRNVELKATISAMSTIPNVLLSTFVYRGGAQEANSEMTRKIAVANDEGNMGMVFPMLMTNGQDVEIWLDTDVGNPTITVTKMIVTIRGL